MFRRVLHGGLTAIAILALASVAVHCSSDRADFVPPPPDAGPPAPFAEPPEAGPDAEAGPPKTDEDVECAGATTNVYVMARNPDAIHRFDPVTLTFTRLGTLDCPASDSFSMAVDRRGKAWVLFNSGKLFHVRLSDLHCQEVVLQNRGRELSVFGMGFAKNDTGDGETLFISANSKLSKVDPSTLVVSEIGPSLGNIAELTGTGDNQLYGFTPYNGVVARLDKATGKSLEIHRTSAVTSGNWAFAQWGGDFWIFTRDATSPTSSVTRYSPATKASDVVVPDAGIRIVGAGVSTCAPYEPPQ